MKKIIRIMMLILLLLLLSGCALPNNRVMTPAERAAKKFSNKDRYYDALKILFQAGNPISRDALFKIEYQKYLNWKALQTKKVANK